MEVDTKQSPTLTVSNLTCSGCERASGNGGAIAGKLSGGRIEIGGSGSTSFSACSATRGGAVFLDLQLYSHYRLYLNPFGSDNSASKTGNNLYLSTSDPSCIIKDKLHYIGASSGYGNDDYCFSNVSNSSNPTDDLPIWVLFSTAGNPLYLSSSSSDAVKCGYDTFPC